MDEQFTFFKFYVVVHYNPNHKSKSKFCLYGKYNEFFSKGCQNVSLNLDPHLDSFETMYVPTTSRNLVLVFKLHVDGYYFKFGNGCFCLYTSNFMIGRGITCDDLYKLYEEKSLFDLC